MSKQQKNKDIQGYNPKPIFGTCSNCKWFKLDVIVDEYNFPHEKNLRCELPELGGFKPKKTGTCKCHEWGIDL